MKIAPLQEITEKRKDVKCRDFMSDFAFDFVFNFTFNRAKQEIQNAMYNLQKPNRTERQSSLNSKHAKIIRQVPAFLDEYQVGTHELFVFGSVAKGEDKFDSDIDVMCVFNDKNFIKNNLSLLREIKSESRYRFDEQLDLHFCSKCSTQTDNSLFMKNFNREKISLSSVN